MTLGIESTNTPGSHAAMHGKSSHIRQAAPLTLLLITIFALAAPVLLADIHLRGLSWLLVVISSSSLGALVFYGDNLHHRCSFFADRGISPTRIWWTRLLPPGIAFLVMLTIVTIVSLGVDSDPIDFPAPPTLSIVIVSVVLFAFGQLVSQWARRPILAFFAAPTYACISMSPVFYLETDPGSGSEALVVPVLLFATWRLTKRWLEGERQAAYTIRVIAYTSLAVLLPCLWISSQRMMPWIANAIGQISLLTGLMP